VGARAVQLELVPDGLATATERKGVDRKTLEQAAKLKAQADKFQVIAPTSWVAARRGMGQRHDREAALRIIGAATGYTPHAKQLALHLSGEGSSVQKFFCAGIGTGKSHAGIVEDLICAMLMPGQRGLIVAPTYDQVLHVLLPKFLALCEALEQAGYPILKRFRWSQMRAELVGGGEVFFRSVSKVDNLLGFEFAWVHFDESETVLDPERVWNTLKGRVRQSAPFRQMLATSTPRGLRGVIAIFHHAREAANDNEREAIRKQWVFIRATSYDNPYLPSDYIPGLKRTYSKRAWDQEVMAKILRPATAVFDEFERAKHSYRGTSREGFIRELIARGVTYDLAYDAGDQFPHVLWIANFAGDRSVIFDELCPDGMTLDRLHAEVIQRCAALKRSPDYIVCDRARKDEIQWAHQAFPGSHIHRMHSRAEQLVAPGVEVVRNRLDPVMGDPLILFGDWLFDSPPRRGITRCMQNLRYQQRPDGTLTTVIIKDNIHDHGTDALRMQQVKRYGGGGMMQTLTARYGYAA
jgi:hypothetical protein